MSEGDVDGAAEDQTLLGSTCRSGLLVKNEENPNKMTPRAFDLLCDNIEQTGMTDPILVAPLNRQKTLNVAASIPNGDMKAAAEAAGSAQVHVPYRRRPSSFRRRASISASKRCR